LSSRNARGVSSRSSSASSIAPIIAPSTPTNTAAPPWPPTRATNASLHGAGVEHAATKLNLPIVTV
jgi:hypothetical protein